MLLLNMSTAEKPVLLLDVIGPHPTVCYKMLRDVSGLLTTLLSYTFSVVHSSLDMSAVVIFVTIN